MTKQRPNYLPLIAILFDLIGIIGIIWGFHLIYDPLGFILGGIGLIVLGLAIDPPARAPKRKTQPLVEGP